MSILSRTIAVNAAPALAAASAAQASAENAQATANAAQTTANAAKAESAAAASTAAQADTKAQAALTALGQQAVRQRNITTPLLPIGTTNVNVVWPTPMPGTEYSIAVTVDSAPAVLGRISASPVQGTRTAAGFTLAITATGLVPIAVGQGIVNCIGILLNNPA